MSQKIIRIFLAENEPSSMRKNLKEFEGEAEDDDDDDDDVSNNGKIVDDDHNDD